MRGPRLWLLWCAPASSLRPLRNGARRATALPSMSTLIAGTADDDQQNSEARKAKGEFVRPKSNLRHALGTADFPAEPGRYHLYVGFNCPWCHRLVLARAILGLEDAISMDVAFPTRSSVPDAEGRDGLWVFKPDGMEVPNGGHVSFPECTADTVNGFQTVVEMYDLGVHIESSHPPQMKFQSLFELSDHEIIKFSVPSHLFLMMYV